MPKSNHLLILLLLVHIAKGIITDIIVPIWEFPDEQAHFAQVSYQVETGTPISDQKNLSYEIYESERILGTLRNQLGNNLFTYHPDHKHQFSHTTIGPYELYLNQLPFSSRTSYTILEAARGEPLFYHLSSIGYSLSYRQNLFTRVNLTRLISILISAFTIFIAYRIGLLLFPSQQLFGISLAILTSFQPMFSFVSAGVNNDNLINLVGALLLYLSLHIITLGLTIPKGLAGIAIIGIGTMTKPLILPLVPGFLLAILYDWYHTKRSFSSQIKLLLPLATLVAIVGGWLFIIPILKTGYIPYLPKHNVDSPSNPMSLLNYLQINLSQHYRQTLVWYWGVFKWLGVVLPLTIIRIIKVMMIISFIGILRGLFKKNCLLKPYQTSFLILYSLSFIITLSLWDWLLIRSIGFSQGLQGRYFFVTLIAHLLLLLVGIVNWAPQKLIPLTAKLASILMIILHSISLYVLASTYYSLENWTTFWIQLSQYEPSFYKYPLGLIWFLVYFGVLFIFLYKFLKISSRKVKS